MYRANRQGIEEMSDHKRKRSRFDKNVRKQETMEQVDNVDETSPVVILFREYQHELDHKYDKHERLVKLSRDITIESKRAIFLLHRVTGSSDHNSILEQANEKLVLVETTKFKEVAQELVDTDPHQFLRAYSPGLQEYIEALTFYHYIKDKKLLSLDQVRKRLTFQHDHETQGNTQAESENLSQANTETESENSTQVNSQEESGKSHMDSEESPPPTAMEATVEALEITDKQEDIVKHDPLTVPVPVVEYILGIADLTGELMRIAINSVGSGNLDVPFQICTFLQEMESGFVSLGYSSREVSRKLFTLRQSLRKVESACYTLQVRGSEIPKHMLVDMIAKDSSVQYAGVDESSIDDD